MFSSYQLIWLHDDCILRQKSVFDVKVFNKLVINIVKVKHEHQFKVLI